MNTDGMSDSRLATRMSRSGTLSRPVRNLSGAPTIRHLAPRTRSGHNKGTPGS